MTFSVAASWSIMAASLLGSAPTAGDVVQDVFARLQTVRVSLGDPDQTLAYVRACVLLGDRVVINISTGRPVPVA